jgi:hypothetical protein
MLQHAYFDCAAETGAWAQAYTDEAKYLYHAWFKLVSRAQLDIEAQLTRNAREFLRFDLSLLNACCRAPKVSTGITSRKPLLKMWAVLTACSLARTCALAHFSEQAAVSSRVFDVRC